MPAQAVPIVAWRSGLTIQSVHPGMRQLVDIALKALSPAVNDPYTAVMSVERLTALLAALAPRQLGDIVLHDTDGPSRVVAHFPTFADYVDLAVGKIRRYGASEPQVAYALLQLLQVAATQTGDSKRRQVLASHARLVLADAERTICQPGGSGLSPERGRDPSRGAGGLRGHRTYTMFDNQLWKSFENQASDFHFVH